MPAELTLLALMLIGFLAKSHIIVAASCILLLIKVAKLEFFLQFIDKHGLDIGLFILLLTIMTPLAVGRFDFDELKYSLTSLPGIFAFLGGALATHLNSQGLKMLELDPGLIFGLIIGSLCGIIFLKGIPVGPLMAAGVAALFMEFVRYLK